MKKLQFVLATFFVASLLGLSVSAQEQKSSPVIKDGLANGYPVAAGVVNGKAASLPKPEYPPAALAVRAEGAVKVQVLIDETGNVISAEAKSGHPLLRASAVEAAKQAKFTTTKLSGQPVKVTGVIVYNFVANNEILERRKKEEETLKPFVLGLMLTIMRDVKAGANPFFSEAFLKDVTPTAEELASDFPALKQELLPLVSLKTLSPDKRIEVANQVYAAVESKLSGVDVWRFDLGKNFGGAFVQIINSINEKEEFDASRFDVAAFKDYLLKSRDLTFSAPLETPPLLLESFKQLAGFGERSFESSEDFLLFSEKVSRFFEDFDPSRPITKVK